MKICLTTLLALTLAACGEIPPPSDAVVAEAAKNCTARSREVNVYYNGYRYSVRCE